MVNEVEAVVVELSDCGFTCRGSSKAVDEAMKDAGMVLLVIDPRKVTSYVGKGLEPEVRAKTKPFFLVPSTTSSSACLALLEISLHFFMLPQWGVLTEGATIKDAVSFVRVDDYVAYGDRVLVALAASGKRVYPAEEAAAMRGFLEPLEELNAQEEADSDEEGAMTGPRSQFMAKIYSKRAWCHWCVGMGAEEGDIIEAQEDALEVLKNEALALPALEGCPPAVDVGPGQNPALCRRAASGGPLLLAASAATAAKYAGPVGAGLEAGSGAARGASPP